MKSLLALSALCLLCLGCLTPVHAHVKGMVTVDDSGSSRITYKGKISRFGYYFSKDPSVTDPGGCKIQIDTAPGIIFMIYLDKTAENTIAKEAICHMAHNALLFGREVTLYEESNSLTEISMSM